MNDSHPIEGARIVAAATPTDSRSPFNRAKLIVRGASGQLLRVQAYRDGCKISGTLLSELELKTLLAQGHALRLPGDLELTPYAELWILRENFPHRSLALRNLAKVGATLVQHPTERVNPTRLCIVEANSREIKKFTGAWCEASRLDSYMNARLGDWNDARQHAELGQSLAPGLDARVLALLCLCYEHCGQVKRASGVREMARRSRGAGFLEELLAELERLRESLGHGLAKDAATR